MHQFRLIDKISFTWPCVLQPFLFFEDISQWEMGFILVLHMVCHLHVFDVIAILKKKKQGTCLWKGTGNARVAADQV